MDDWKSTLLAVFSFVLRTIDESNNVPPPSEAVTSTWTTEGNYSNYFVELLHSLNDGLKDRISVVITTVSRCICEDCDWCDEDETTGLTISLHMEHCSTIQSLFDSLLETSYYAFREGVGVWPSDVCTAYTLTTTSYIIVENTNVPTSRHADGNNTGNTQITVSEIRYVLIAVVFKKQGNVMTAVATEGGAMPSITSWYFAIYKRI